ncbi:hypothetical protein [Nonomuraea angiospora]
MLRQVVGRAGDRIVAGRGKITAVQTSAPGNRAALGGVQVATEPAWFAARPSGTEDVYEIYAESFRGPGHLAEVQEDACSLVSAAPAG